MSKTKMSIIIVTYATGEILKECLSSVRAFCPDAEVIIVDNHPEQIDTHSYGSLFKDMKFIPNPANNGFGGGNNIGAQQASGEFLFFLNPDTIIEVFNTKKLIDFQEKNPDALTGFPLFYPDGGYCKPLKYLPEIDFILPKKLYNLLYKINLKRDGFISKRLYNSGAAFAMSKSLFEETGGFNERMFLFFEENYLRSNLIKMKRYNPAVLSNGFRIIHHEGKSYNTNAISWYVNSLEIYASKFRKPYLIPYKRFCVALSLFFGNLKNKDGESKRILLKELKKN